MNSGLEWALYSGIYDSWDDKDFLLAMQNAYNHMRCLGAPRDEEMEAEIKQLRNKVQREMER